MAALAVKPPSAGDTALPLVTVFQSFDASSCNFWYLPGAVLFFTSSAGTQTVDMVAAGVTSTIAFSVSFDDRKRILLDLLIRVNGLNLTPDDFVDPANGDFDCSHEKLLSLL